jgi:urease accessory protein UreE
MNEIKERYEKLVLEEDDLNNKIKTCQTAIDAVMMAVLKEGDSLHMLTTEDVIVAIHKLEMDARTELLHLQLRKFKFSYTLSHGTNLGIKVI